jgi:3-phosphoshikimate 1-carboxyvinyltransferase
MDCHIIPQVRSSLKAEISDIPGDKSISHRAVIITALSKSKVRFRNFLLSEDCLNTIKIFQSMGVGIKTMRSPKELVVQGVGKKGLTCPKKILDVGNSGTSLRLITGVLAGQNFNTTITGDASIQKRPMKRIIAPLAQMGAHIKGVKNSSYEFCPPLKISGQKLTALSYEMPISSAQVKSCLMLAALYSNEKSVIKQKDLSRDHTERMLKLFNADISLKDKEIHISGKNELVYNGQKEVLIPSDISSAAFFIILGLVTKNSCLTLKNIGLNPTRDRLLTVLKNMGAKISIQKQQGADFEPMADLEVESSKLKNLEISQDIAYFIDEIPVLAVAAMFGNGSFVVRNAKELRVKESDRIKAVVELVRKMGGQITEYADGFELIPTHNFQDFELDANLDHRIAMAAIIGALASNKKAQIKNCDCIKTSFPNFFRLLDQLGLKYACLYG